MTTHIFNSSQRSGCRKDAISPPEETTDSNTPVFPNTTPLFRDPAFIRLVKEELFLSGEPLSTPTNEEIVNTARIAGFPISSSPQEEGMYTPGSAKAFVKVIKQKILEVLCQHTKMVFDELREESPNFKKVIDLLESPINYAAMRGSKEARHAAVARAIRCKLSFGFSEGLMVSEGAIARKLANIIADDIGLPTEPSDWRMERLVRYGMRHLRMSMLGAEDALFNNRRPTPSLLDEVRQTLKQLVTIPPNSGISPTQVVTALPGLYQMLRRIYNTDDIALAGQVIVDAAKVELTLSSPKRNWRSVAVRRQFYHELVRNAEQHPNDLSLNTLHLHAPGLMKYYSTDVMPLSARETVLELFNEFHPNGCSQLMRDQIMGCATKYGKQWLALRYYDPNRARSHYSNVLGYKNDNCTWQLISELGNNLAEAFRRGESTRSIADRFNVGRRGLGEIRDNFQSDKETHSAGVPFYRRGGSITKDLYSLTPKRTFLTYTDLAEELCNDKVARILLGCVDSRRIARDKVIYSDKSLVVLRDLITELRKEIVTANEEAVRGVVGRIRDTLDMLLMKEETLVQLPRQGRLGESSYTLPKAQFSRLSNLINEVVAELEYSH